MIRSTALAGRTGGFREALASMAHFSARVSKAQGLNAQVELPGMFNDKLSNLRRDLQKFLSEIVDPLPHSNTSLGTLSALLGD